MLINKFTLQGYVSGGVILNYNVSPTLTDTVVLNSSSSSVGPWVQVASLDKLDRQFIVYDSMVAEGTAWYQLLVTARDSSTETSLLHAIIDQAEGTGPMAIATDEEGVPRSLKVDAGGNLCVSGITINGVGTSDATSAQQSQQIVLATNANTKLDSIKASVDTVANGLGNVSLSASTVSFLQKPTVQNFPVDYPDSAAQVKLTSIDTKVATEASLATAVGIANTLVKRSDLTFDTGALTVKVVNNPVNFPDAAVLGKLGDLETAINAVKTSVDSGNTSTGSTAATSTAMNANVQSVAAGVLTTNTQLGLMSSDVSDISNAIAAIQLITAKDSSLSTISTKLDSLFKPTDLPVTAGKVNVQVGNFPTDYSDSVTHTKLDQVMALLATIDTSAVTIDTAIPAGNNLIGSVNVNTLPLPANAATNTAVTTLNSSVQSLLTEWQSVGPGSVKELLTQLITSSDHIFDAVNPQNQDVVSTSGSIVDFAPYVTFQTPSLDTGLCDSLTVNIALDGAVCAIATLYASTDNVTFYPMADYNSMPISAGMMKSITFSHKIHYLKLGLSNASHTATIPKIYYEIRGK